VSYQVLGYFENPLTSKARELAQFTYRQDLDTKEQAQAIAQDWRKSDRYPFIFIRNTLTKESEQQ
jgi:hypothetical protein